MDEPLDWPNRRTSPRRRMRFWIFALAVVFLISASTTLSYYVDALWFGALGYSQVFWTTLNYQAAAFCAFTLVTFAAIYGAFLLFKPDSLSSLTSGGTILINGQPVRFPMEPALRLIGLVVSLAIALITGAGMMGEWPTLALAWYGGSAVSQTAPDPIFGRPLAFYLFTLPAWDLLSGWILTLSVVVCGIALFFVVVGGGTKAINKLRGRSL